MSSQSSSSSEKEQARFLPFVRFDVPVFSSPYELFKTAVMLPMMPLRAIMMVIMLFIYSCMCYAAAYGTPDSAEASSIIGRSWWRQALLWPGAWMARFALLISLGMWVSVTPDSDFRTHNSKGQKAQIWVSNHVSFIDVIVSLAAVHPTLGFVAKRAIWNIPLVGACAKTWGCIPVDREQKGTPVVTLLKERTQHPERNPVVVFPEGTTSNGKYLMHFHRGAFVAGLPVKPMILRYPSTQFSPSWESITAGAHIFRFLTQFVNKCTVTLLPVYTPSAEEIADPSLYAENVRVHMARVSGLKLSDATLEDKKEYLGMLRGDKRLD